MTLENQNGTTYQTVGQTPGGLTARLNDLLDVSINNANNGEAILFDATTGLWFNQSLPATGAQTLNELNDVNAPNPSTNEVLTWNGANWAALPAQGSTPVSEISDLTDVDTTGVATDNILVWNGAAWVPQINTTIVRATFNPAAIVLGQDTIFDTYALVTPVSFVLGTNTIDYAEAVLPVNSDGASAITWDVNMRNLADHAASLPTVLPVGINTLRMIWDNTLGLMLVEVTTQGFTADGAQPMTGNLDLGNNNIVNVNQINAEYIKREPFTAPTSGAFTPNFLERSDFAHGTLSGALTINNPTNQEIGQEGVISFDNSAGFVSDAATMLGNNFVIMSGKPTAIPSSRIIIPYKVFTPGVIFYSVEYA